MRTEEFKASLPYSPLNQHIAQVHALIEHTYQLGRAGLPMTDAKALAEHSLRSIAIFTAEPYGVLASRGTHDYPGVMDLPSAMKSAVKGMGEAFAKMREGLVKPKQPLDGLNERLSQRNHLARIEDERRAGTAFVKAYAAKTRKEMGL